MLNDLQVSHFFELEVGYVAEGEYLSAGTEERPFYYFSLVLVELNTLTLHI